MPIITFSVVRHLGVVSQTRKEDFQNIFKQAEEIRALKQSTAIRNPFQITEQFIEKYNLSHGSDEQEKYVELAKQLLSRSQRRAGLKCMGEGHSVDLPLAWTELLLLGLCSGKIQNDSLDSLLMSLDHAPVQAEQIHALFYLGESVLYWVRAETPQKHRLYVCEVKMLKLGYLVFLRLFLFHISGNLKGYQRNKSQLHNFLKALSRCQSCYGPFPNILFAVHFMLRTGEIICGHGQTHNETTTMTESESQEYDVNQVLWHCLLCWYCVQNNVSQLPQVTQHLILLREQLQNDNWVDSALGLMVLGEAAKSNMLCLQTLMSLHFNPDNKSLQKDNEGKSLSPRCSWPWQLEHVYTTVLADVCLHSSNAEIQKTALMGNHTLSRYHNTDGLLTLLIGSGRGDWQLCYSVVQALVCVWRGLSRAPLQDGLRNAAWVALQDLLGQDIDLRIRDASRTIEAEMSIPDSNPLFGEECGAPSTPAAGVVSDHKISWRLACTLSQFYLPPAPLPLQPCTRPQREPAPSTSTGFRQKASSEPRHPPPAGKTQEPTRPALGGRASSPRHERMYVDFNTRTDGDLMKVVEDQWQKELQIKMAEEEEAEKNDLAEKEEEARERFKEIMRRRKEKVKKETAPYELLHGCDQTEL